MKGKMEVMRLKLSYIYVLQMQKWWLEILVLFCQIAVQTLWNIKLAVLVKPEHENRISHVGMSSVKTGIANTLGNNNSLFSVIILKGITKQLKLLCEQ